MCGVRDVRDHRSHSTSGNEYVAGGSAFTIGAESLQLGNFSRPEVEALLAQLTAETGQALLQEAVERHWIQTLG